jgi:hypothetical protein
MVIIFGKILQTAVKINGQGAATTQKLGLPVTITVVMPRLYNRDPHDSV